MEPGEEALRTRRGRKTVTLGPPVALLFAAAGTPSENEWGERGGNACQRPVGLEHQSRLGSVVRGQGITGSFQSISGLRRLGECPRGGNVSFFVCPVVSVWSPQWPGPGVKASSRFNMTWSRLLARHARGRGEDVFVDAVL